MGEIITLKKDIVDNIVFLSDIHIDHYNGEHRPDLNEQYDLFMEKIESVMIEDSILIIAGDISSDYRTTLRFIDDMERLKIKGFVTLGNHDYWSQKKYTIQEIIDIFDEATIDNQNFRLLMTGRKYYVDDLCIIGDTGWTSFKSKGIEYNAKDLDLKYPNDVNHVKEYTSKNILELHNKWSGFANNIYIENERVLTVTHYPMVDMRNNRDVSINMHRDKQEVRYRDDNETKDRVFRNNTLDDIWWSSDTNLVNDEGWFIFGHTHNARPVQKEYNHISHQRGYSTGLDGILNTGITGRKIYNDSGFSKGRFIERFGLLYRKRMDRNEVYDLKVPSKNILNAHYSDLLLTNIKKSEIMNMERTYKIRGFKRPAANINNMLVLINDKEGYLNKVNHNFDNYTIGDILGFGYSNELSSNDILSIESAISIIRNDSLKNIREYITSIIITGYVYNNMMSHIPDMRVIDEYDILRLWLLFLTLKERGILPEDITTIRGSQLKGDTFEYQGLLIRLPIIRGEILTKEEVLKAMVNVPMFKEAIDNEQILLE